MLAAIDLHQAVSGAEFKALVEPLQWRLYALQRVLFQQQVPVVVVLEGWAAAGKGGVISRVAEALDPRGLRVVPVLPARPDEQRFPWLHRFWLNTPAAGQIVIFDSSWYRRVLIERHLKLARRAEWQTAYADIRAFERTLTDTPTGLGQAGALLLKYWLHIGKKTQRRRFEALQADKLTRWQVDEEDLAQHRAYRRYYKLVEQALAETHAPHAPWTVVAATDKPYAQLTVLAAIVGALEQRLGQPAPAEPSAAEADHV